MSRFGIKKYCSKECAKKDNYGFKPRRKKCIICGSEFIINSGLNAQKKTCSNECWYENQKKISLKRTKEKENKKCTICGKDFVGLKNIKNTGKCQSCRTNDLKKRTDDNNPNYRGGYYTKKNYKGTTAWIHQEACKKYKKNFIEKNGYQFCEICCVNKNGTSLFNVHHIYFASKVPKHKNLHNEKNLIHVCRECHLKFHNGKEYEVVFQKLEKERGLKELFS